MCASPTFLNKEIQDSFLMLLTKLQGGNKVLKHFYRLSHKSILIIYGIVLTFIFILNIFMSRNYQSIASGAPKFFNVITLLLSLGILTLLILFRTKLLDLLKRFPVKRTSLALLVISIIIQFLSLNLFMVNPTWDFKVVIDSSKILLETGELIDYFVRYNNNSFVVCLLALVGLIFGPDLFIYELFNIFVITISQYLIFKIGFKVGGKTTGLISLFISVLFFPYIFYASIVYTDTLSLPFLLLPLNLLLGRNGKFSFTLIRLTLASIIFSLGLLLKGSLIIFIIALSIVIIIFAEKQKKLLFVLPFVSLLVMKTLFNFTIYGLHILEEDQVKSYSFPVTHWIMMGQREETLGKWSGEDVEFTESLFNNYSKDEIKRIHLAETKKRIIEKGWRGNVLYSTEKIAHTWTDGTYYSLNKIKRYPVYPQNFERLTNGTSGLLLQGFARIQHLLILFGLLFALLLKPKGDFITFIMLSIIGFFLFFILWEARSRYILSVTPLFILMCSYVYTCYKGKIFTKA